MREESVFGLFDFSRFSCFQLNDEVKPVILTNTMSKSNKIWEVKKNEKSSSI